MTDKLKNYYDNFLKEAIKSKATLLEKQKLNSTLNSSLDQSMWLKREMGKEIKSIFQIPKDTLNPYRN